MGITLSPQDYATAFHLLATTARHPENIGQLVEQRLLPRLSPAPTLLDVGAGSGKVSERLASHFRALTLLEPNPNQITGLSLDKAKVVLEPLERYQGSEQYDLVVCSHVLYHVPQKDWGGFIDRLLALTRPGGTCLVIMTAARGPTYELCRDFSSTLLFGEQLVDTVRAKGLPHEVIPTMSGFRADTFEAMYTLCRFFVFEGCFTAEQLAALAPEQLRAMDERIRWHTERCRGPDGVYRLEQDEDIILLPKG